MSVTANIVGQLPMSIIQIGQPLITILETAMHDGLVANETRLKHGQAAVHLDAAFDTIKVSIEKPSKADVRLDSSRHTGRRLARDQWLEANVPLHGRS